MVMGRVLMALIVKHKLLLPHLLPCLFIIPFYHIPNTMNKKWEEVDEEKKELELHKCTADDCAADNCPSWFRCSHSSCSSVFPEC